MSTFPKITAKNLQEFEDITNSVKELPESIIANLEVCKKELLGLVCEYKSFKYTGNLSENILLPKDIRSISHNTKTGEIHAFSTKYTIKIEIAKDQTILYEFI